MTLISTNLQQAHSMFVSYIVAAKQQNVDPAVLNDVYQEKIARLDQSMTILTQIATEGIEEQISPLLNTLLQEWAIKEAIELLLRYQHCAIDPSHQGLQQSFWDKLRRQHQALSSEVHLQLQRGKQQRAQAHEAREQSWQSVAVKSFEKQQNAALQWMQGQQQMNQQWFQHQQQMFGHYQESNQQWANVAMNSVQQAQVGMKQWYDFASVTQNNVASMLASTDQRQAMMVEQAVHKASVKKWITRLIISGLVIGGSVGLFGLAFFMLMHLY